MRINEVVNSDQTIVYHGNQGGIHRDFITPMWWTESYKDAKNYATQNDGDGWIYKAELTCKNLYILEADQEMNQLVSQYVKLRELGYDCIHDPTVGDWVPFYSKDIKQIGKPEYVES
jgi:hypothetical protein